MSTAIQIVEVRPATHEETAFIDLPGAIYADNPHYVPWFRRQMRAIVARRHPFFEHSDGAFFIARRGEHTVGRIALLEPRRFNEYNHERDARFYFFECEDDREAAHALFRHGAEWARQRGLRRLVGPQGFSGFAGSGILIHGFDRTASMTMMPYHLPYYRDLVESFGFEPHQDFHSPYLDASTHDLSPRYVRAAGIVRKRGRFHVPELRSKGELRALAHEIGTTYNEAWRDRENFTPITEAELKGMVDDLLLVTRPDLIRVLRAGGELAGFVLAFPDLSPAMVRAGGRLTPLSYLRLIREKHTTRRFIINGLGIKPAYRRAGGTALLFYEITKILKEHQVEGAEMTQIAADNELMMANVERLNAEIVKTHRVYQKDL